MCFATSKRYWNDTKLGNWLPHEMTERDIQPQKIICEFLLQRQKRKCFLHRIFTGDKRWIHCDNPKTKAAWVNLGEHGTSKRKENILGSKVILSIWRNQNSVIYYELLKSSETITGELYRFQLIRLRRALDQNGRINMRRSFCNMIKLHVHTVIKNYFRRGKLGSLKLPAVFTRYCSFGLSFVPFESISTYWRALEFC